MFDLGFQELIIIFLVALLVFGPKKLPELGRTLGKWVVEIRRGIHMARAQMENELDVSEKKTAQSPEEVPFQEIKPADHQSDPSEERENRERQKE